VARKAPTLQDAKVQRLLNALATGHYMRRACRLAKVAEPTVYVWINHGKAERERISKGESPSPKMTPYLEILEAIEVAQEQAAHVHMMTILEASKKGDVRAATWYLSRTDREHYGDRTVVTGPNDGPVQVRINREEVSQRMLEWLREMGRDEDADGDSEEPA
jgi:hypothetical protein